MLTHTRPMALWALRWGLVVAVLVPALAGDAPYNRWTGMTSLGFTHGVVQIACPNQPSCEAAGFAIDSDTFAFCTADPGNPYSCTGSVFSFLGWSMTGEAGFNPGPPPADLPFAFRLEVSGELISPDVFRVSGETFDSATMTDESIELAVFRFDGDPTVLDGLRAESVDDLVSLGLIDPGDVLVVRTFPTDAPSGTFAVDVDVAGIDAGELVIFGAGNGPFPSSDVVPAASGPGALALALAMLSLASWLLRRRRAARDAA